jgi:CcmD family protein
MLDATPDTFPSLFYGYTALWAILALYIFSLGKRLTTLEQTNKEDLE